MIVVTGAAGFIGSFWITKLNLKGFYDLEVIVKFDKHQKRKNLEGKYFTQKVDQGDFFNWLAGHQKPIHYNFKCYDLEEIPTPLKHSMIFRRKYPLKPN